MQSGTWPGLARAMSMTSFTVFAGKAALATIITGACTRSVTGSKDFWKSYCTL